MDADEAARVQATCLERMKNGGMTPEERLACFADFEATAPTAELVRHFYDVWALDYDTDMDVAGYRNPIDVSTAMEELFPDVKSIKILDLGAGTGEGGKKLAAAGFTNIDAMDGSPAMLKEAEKLGVYKALFPELLLSGQKLETVPSDYDAIVSSGSFYPGHLQGHHLECFLPNVKAGGKLVLSACPYSDKDVNLRPVLKDLEAAGVIKILKETYVPKWFQRDDGTVWVLEKLQGCSAAGSA
eukprot:TRINITY_DN75348_c0_g1_i1.p1 TRINITY_DN75348_c0_g1~~TRINITY_DN75348_c0_g1_i1.p1  ORF type:complete len:242 (-),score=58.51 TRINITY_DN75348_c0_g1_i1:381-1106(-)